MRVGALFRETENDGRDLPKDACEEVRKCEGLGLITDR